MSVLGSSCAALRKVAGPAARSGCGKACIEAVGGAVWAAARHVRHVHACMLHGKQEARDAWAHLCARSNDRFSPAPRRAQGRCALQGREMDRLDVPAPWLFV
jgi:hypothetical protein